MAVIHTEKKPFNLAMPLMAGTAIVAAAGIWWYAQEATPTAVTPITSTAVGTTQATMPVAETTPPPQVVAQLINDQKATAQQIEAQPQIQPATGTVEERPSFLTDMEWSVLKAVAMQQADPDRALTALVNKVRFTKQLEVWQDLPGTTEASKRQLLANELLQDLPQRLTNEDMDLPGAQKLLTELLQDAEPDEKSRAKRAAKEAKRLEKALPSKAAQGQG